MDITKRRFEPGNGLFKKGIKTITRVILSEAEQIREIQRLPGVRSFNTPERSYNVNLGWAGTYNVYIEDEPRAYRTDRSSEANPFIGSYNKICLGISKQKYNRCYNNRNYLDCAILINLTLACKDDSHGYRGQKWRDLR